MESAENPAYPYARMFRRNIGLVTEEMQALFRRSTIAIAGLGGVGGDIALTMAQTGICGFKLADPEAFECDNLNRQEGAKISTLGRKKAHVLTEMVRDTNPYARIETFDKGVIAANVDAFLDGVDLVIDAVDYGAPADKLILYQKAREKNLFVLSSPITGFGALLFCFDPNGMTVEEAFAYPGDPEGIRTHRIPIERLMGCPLDYLTPLYFEKIQKREYLPTIAPSASVAGGVKTTAALKVLLHRERQKNPAAFPDFGSIPLATVPFVTRFDIWDPALTRVLDLRNLEQELAAPVETNQWNIRIR